MRKYPQNSPQAAARIISLTIVADGDVSNAEFTLLEQLAMHEQLGIDRDSLHEVFDTFCADLLSDNQLAFAGACPVNEYTLSSLMAEIDDPQLRRRGRVHGSGGSGRTLGPAPPDVGPLTALW